MEFIISRRRDNLLNNIPGKKCISFHNNDKVKFRKQNIREQFLTGGARIYIRFLLPLLNDVALKLNRADFVYITNLVKCKELRPVIKCLFLL